MRTWHARRVASDVMGNQGPCCSIALPVATPQTRADTRGWALSWHVQPGE